MFESSQENSESGIILILLAVLVTVLLAFAALVIDLTLYANWREQAQHYARLASLAALEAHLKDATLAGSTPDRNYGEALKRATEITGKNFTITDKAEINVGTLKEPAAAGDGAELIPGRWFFSEPVDGTDPCGGTAKYPCFQAVDLSQADPPQVTAYRVSGTLFGGLATKFAGFAFGVNSLDTPVLATATLVPRRGCFLVDLSASMTRETHLLAGSVGADNNPNTHDNNPLTRGSDFAYYLQNDRPQYSNEGTVGSDYLWTELINSPLYAQRPTNETEWNTFLNSLEAGRSLIGPPELTNDIYQSFHFVDDYVRMKTLGDGDYQAHPHADKHPDPEATPPAGVSYEVINDEPGTQATDGRLIRVDKFRSSSGFTPVGSSTTYTYNGPEPLRTVFQGLSTAFKEFKDRQVAGDAACLIMYDSTFSWPRFVKMTDEFDYLQELVDFDNMSGMPTSDEDASTSALGVSGANLGFGFNRIVRHGLLPIGEGGNSTNTQLAISEAVRELATNTGDAGFSSNFIVVMSDGLNNCYPKPKEEGGGYECDNDHSHWEKSKDALQDYVATAIQGTNIPVHWIMFGRNVKPHTLRLSDGSGKCLSEEAARAKNISLIDPARSSQEEEFDKMSAANPFHEANIAPYEIAVGTRGLWGPIRPKATDCDPKNPPPCTPGGVQDTDPLCRTPEDQIKAYMNKILGDNPFTLVEAQ